MIYKLYHFRIVKFLIYWTCNRRKHVMWYENTRFFESVDFLSVNGTHTEKWLIGCFWPYSYVYPINLVLYIPSPHIKGTDTWKSWKFIQIDIRDTDLYSDSDSIFQVIAHSNQLFNNDLYKKSLSAF